MATHDGKNLNPVIRRVEQFGAGARSQLSKRIEAELDSDIEDEIDSHESK